MPKSMMPFSTPILASTLADSLSNALPRMLHSESELLTRSDATRMASPGLRLWLAKSASFWSRVMPKSMMPFSAPILASTLADSLSKLLPRTLHSVTIVEAERYSASGVAIPGPKFSPDRSHVVILLVGLSRRALKMLVQPSTPRLLPRTLTHSSRAVTAWPPRSNPHSRSRATLLAPFAVSSVPLSESDVTLGLSAQHALARVSGLALTPSRLMLKGTS